MTHKGPVTLSAILLSLFKIITLKPLLIVVNVISLLRKLYKLNNLSVCKRANLFVNLFFSDILWWFHSSRTTDQHARISITVLTYSGSDVVYLGH